MMTSEMLITPNDLLYNLKQNEIINKADCCVKQSRAFFISSHPAAKNSIINNAQNLIKVFNSKFNLLLDIAVCPIVSATESLACIDADEIVPALDVNYPPSFAVLSRYINNAIELELVIIQYDVEYFKNKEDDLIQFLKALIKPVVFVVSTLILQPDKLLKQQVKEMCGAAMDVIVFINSIEEILIGEYEIAGEKVTLIEQDVLAVEKNAKEVLKLKYKLAGKTVLTTLGSLSCDRGIETTLYALPGIINKNPDCMFLIIGKTNPSVVKEEGYKYRNILDTIVRELQLQNYVEYINYDLSFSVLMEYLQLTDIYLFTSRDARQAVNGIFLYALSNGCPVISTPTPHALETLQNSIGIIIDFDNPQQLEEEVINLLNEKNKL